MAVENKYVNAEIVDGKLTAPSQTGNGEVVVARQTVAIAAADDNGSVYRVFKSVPAHLVPLKIEIGCTAITGGTDYDLGLYETNLGAVKDADILMDGQTMAAASLNGLDGLAAIGVADGLKPLWELAGDTVETKKASYDIALTANTVGTADGTILVTAYFAQK